MVFYAMFSDMAKGKGNSLFGIILNFSWIAGVGPILGVGIGFISTFILNCFQILLFFFLKAVTGLES